MASSKPADRRGLRILCLNLRFNVIEALQGFDTNHLQNMVGKAVGFQRCWGPFRKKLHFSKLLCCCRRYLWKRVCEVFDFGDFELLNAANGLDVKYINLPGHSSSCAASGSHLSVQLQSTSINCICCPYAAWFLSISGPRLLEGMQERGCQAQLSATAAKV